MEAPEFPVSGDDRMLSSSSAEGDNGSDWRSSSASGSLLGVEFYGARNHDDDDDGWRPIEDDEEPACADFHQESRETAHWMETGVEEEEEGGGGGRGGGGGDDQHPKSKAANDNKDNDDDDNSSSSGNDEEIRDNLRRIANRFSFCNKEETDGAGWERGDKNRMEGGGRGGGGGGVEEGCRIQRLLDKISELEATASKLEREKSAVTDWMAVKNAESDEERLRSGSKIHDLEDEVQRLRAEKSRLVALFQLPESDRTSLRVLEDELEDMRKRLSDADSRCFHLATDNDELRAEVRDAELEMQELHDQFQQEESLELRELRKELENTARDIRLLHFKLRKAERRNDELRSESDDYEAKIRRLEERGRGSDEDRKRIRRLEEELRTAKEVSIRMHDECQRMETEQRKMEDELERLRRPVGVEGGGSDPAVTSEVEHRSGKTTFSREQSFEGSSSLSWMLQKAAETATRIPKVEDTATCLRLCRDLEKILQQAAGCPPSQGGPAGGPSGAVGPEQRTAGAAPEGEGEWQERDKELRIQLALADEEAKLLRRKLTEMRTDNENLMRAVEYLRKKLEQNDVKESPPSKHRFTTITTTTTTTTDRQDLENKDAAQQQQQQQQQQDGKRDVQSAARGSDGETGSPKTTGRNPGDSSLASHENQVAELENQVRVLREECQRLKRWSIYSADGLGGGDGGGGGGLEESPGKNTVENDSAVKWKDRMMELQNEIVLLTEELQSTTETNERLMREVGVCRSELESLLETLRRKERQFAEERKVLKRRNNDLSKIFDLLTERASSRRRKTKDDDDDDDEEEEEEEEEEGRWKKRKTVEDATQTEEDEEAMITASRPDQSSVSRDIEAFDRYKTIMEKEKSDLEVDLKAKEEILKSKEEVIKRKDFLLGRAVKSLQDLETSVEEKTALVTEKEKELADMENDLRYCKERADLLEKETRKMEEKITKLEGAAEEHGKMKTRLSSIESDLQTTLAKVKALEDDLQTKDAEIRTVRSDHQQMKTQLDKAKVKVKELEMDRDGLLREKKKMAAETSKEKERLELELEKASAERSLAQKELSEMETMWKKSGEAGGREDPGTWLRIVEDRGQNSTWIQNTQEPEQRTPAFAKSQETITKCAGATKASFVPIPVLHERASFPSPSPTSSSPSTSAGGNTFTVDAASAADVIVRPEVEPDTRTGTGSSGRDSTKVHATTTQRYRTTEQHLNPVATTSNGRGRHGPWEDQEQEASAIGRRSRRSGRTASVDRYTSQHLVPVQLTAELLTSLQSHLPVPPSSTATTRQVIQLRKNRAPSVETSFFPSASETELKEEGDRKFVGEQTISFVAPVLQPREPGSALDVGVASVTPKFRTCDRNEAVSTSSSDFRRRSRSMSEFDDFSAGEADDTLQVAIPPPPPTPPPPSDPVETIPRAVIPQSAPDSGLDSSSASPQGLASSGVVVMRHRKSQASGSGSGLRGSFYASGTLSASASRATSPVAPDLLLLPGPLRRRLTPYPVPPPSMIISPARTPVRASSTDRGDRTLSHGDVELLRRKLERVETTKTSGNHPPEVLGTTGNGRTETVGSVETMKESGNRPPEVVGTTGNHRPEVVGIGNRQPEVLGNAGNECQPDPVGIGLAEPAVASFRRGSDFYHSWNRPRMVERPDHGGRAGGRGGGGGGGGKPEKRSMSVSPRTARRKFFDEYPYDPPKDTERPDRWRTRRKSNRDDDDVTAATAAAKSRHSDVTAAESGDDDVTAAAASAKMTSSSSVERKPEEEAVVRRTTTTSTMLRFSTLPFFRKKSGVPDHPRQQQQQQLDSCPLPVGTVAASGALTRSLPRLQLPRFSVAFSSGDASKGHRQGQTTTGVKPEVKPEVKAGVKPEPPGSRGKDEKEKENLDFQEPLKKSRDLKKSKSVDPKDQRSLPEWEKEKEKKEEKRDPDEIRDSSDRRSREPTRFGFGLRKVVVVPQHPTSSTQSLDQLNSTKFQRIIKPFRKLGSAPAGGGDRRAGGGGGKMSSKRNSRGVLFPAFHSLSESTIRSISLSSDLLKELNVGGSRVTAKSDDEDGLADDQRNANRGSSHSIKMIPDDDPVQFRSLDRKSKKFY